MTNYYTCNCDKYKPDCRCHPKPDDLRTIVARAICDDFEGKGFFDNWLAVEGECDNYFIHADAAIAAATPIIRAAIGPTMPVIPEGWWLDSLNSSRHWDRGQTEMIIDGYVATIATYDGDHLRFEFGEGSTWHDALAAAIEAAQKT